MARRKKVSQRSLKTNESAFTASELHTPVLLDEVLRFLQPETGLFIDCTLGMGGHTEAILNTSAETKVIAFDRDREAIEKASARLTEFGERFRAIHADFRQIKEFVEAETASGVLADLGVSSWQLDSVERGFSFRADAPLDMRMNSGSEEPTAAELLETLSEEEIADIIYQYGEERFSRRIARRIVERRERGEKIETTAQLAELIERAIPRAKQEKIHPATRTFQALRIAVNRELENLDEFISNAIDILQPDGRFAVISFHSLEDRIVKQTFRRLSGRCECPPRLPVCQCGAVKRIEILTARPVMGGEKEIEENPRARSAKLRVCRKLAKEEI
ncbi:MAG: 16S rRNA (cytosine(1402)-N(4))-methyltransferase RsmH [Acidobacteriota bacterium]|nr:16S rRNA (cytosine(1402)-N(4))-methyltransferase RsmH [Acidobacteriota bacterium]